MTLNQKQGEFKVTKIDSKKQQRGKQKVEKNYGKNLEIIHLQRK